MGQRRDLGLRPRDRQGREHRRCIRISSRTITTRPAFLVRKDGRYLGRLQQAHQRAPDVLPDLGAAQSARVGAGDDRRNARRRRAGAGQQRTYANLFRMPDGRIYNFIRAFHHDPNYMYSDDDGSTWTYGGHWLHGKGGYSPYLKYADDGKGTIHFIATEDHPRNFDNSLYHGYVRDGVMYQTDGTRVNALEHDDRSHQRDVGLSRRSIRARRTASRGWWTSSSMRAIGRMCCSRRRATAADCRAARAAWICAITTRGSTADGWHHEEIAYAGTRLYRDRRRLLRASARSTRTTRTSSTFQPTRIR